MAFLGLILAAITVTKLSVIVRSLNKGFDFSDQPWTYPLVEYGKDAA
jgi:hypothetical protein